MNIHEIFERYKDKRETIMQVYLDLQEQCNEIRRQRDFAMTMIKFIDMKSAIDTPQGTFEEVVRLMHKKDDQKVKEFELAQERYELQKAAILASTEKAIYVREDNQTS